jgi:hypothetical protein
MRILTRKEALQRCKKQWLWAAETGGLKQDYPFEDGRPLGTCYACEYDHQQSVCFCGEYCIIPWPGGGCQADESPFTDYEKAVHGSEEEKEAALAIAALCDKGLTALKNE